MQLDDTLYKAFLEELQELEKFRMSYTALHPAAPLDREDQDVRRLIEALAVFSTRTRQAGQRTLARGTMRLFQQHFSYLLNPVPAVAMLRAVPDARFVDATELPRGTPLLLNPGSAAAPTGPLTFRTPGPAAPAAHPAEPRAGGAAWHRVLPPTAVLREWLSAQRRAWRSAAVHQPPQ